MLKNGSEVTLVPKKKKYFCPQNVELCGVHSLPRFLAHWEERAEVADG
jgi:hypothetical protein